MRTAGTVLLVLGCLYLLWGLVPPGDRAANLDEAQAMARERRLDGFVGGALLLTVGFVLRLLHRAPATVNAVAVENWLSIPVTADAERAIKSTIAERRYPSGSGIRIIEGPSTTQFDVKYDLPSDDADDCMAESNGVTIFVHKSLASRIRDKCIDLKDGTLQLVSFGQQVQG
jgi:Fe-S cluster assembly iron-binding protein IscA